MPSLLDRFQRLPPAQKALIGFGVPAAAGAALVGRFRSAPADDETPPIGTEPAQDVTPVALSDIFALFNAVSDLESRLDEIEDPPPVDDPPPFGDPNCPPGEIMGPNGECVSPSSLIGDLRVRLLPVDQGEDVMEQLRGFMGRPPAPPPPPPPSDPPPVRQQDPAPETATAPAGLTLSIPDVVAANRHLD